jgi:hypothetical protein
VTLVPFSQLPDKSQLWIFGIERYLTEAEEINFVKELDEFLEAWAAHGEVMICGREVTSSRFLFVAVDLTSVPPSGCSIDGLVHFLKKQELGLDLKIIDNSPIWYRSKEGIERVSREEFRELALDGAVTETSTVFDTGISRLSELRTGQWEKFARDSWHKIFFRK